jgi:hypothetical protein
MRLKVWCKDGGPPGEYHAKPELRARELGNWRVPAAPRVGEYLILHGDFYSMEVLEVHHELAERRVYVEVAWVNPDEWPPVRRRWWQGWHFRWDDWPRWWR